MSHQLSKLKSGSTLITVDTPSFASSTIMAIVKAGPRFDPPTKTGLSHLTEHLLSKGTQKYPTSERFSLALEKNGAESNAFTYHETNAYWIKTPSQNLALAAELLTQQLHYPLIRPVDVIREKETVKEELRIVENNPSSLIWEIWSENIWRGSPLGRSYVGTNKSIEGLNASDIQNHLELNYLPQNITYIVCGNISSQNISSLLNQLVPILPAQTASFIPILSLKKDNHIKFLSKDTSNVTVLCGFLTTRFSDPDTHALELISYILGRGWGCRLRQKIAEAGLTYSITAHVKHLTDTGYFAIKFTSSPQNLNTVVDLIGKELQFIKNGQLSDVEIERAKGYFAGQTLINSETSDDLASWYGYQATFKTEYIVDPNQKSQIIQETSKDEIVRIANKYFTTTNWHISAVGPKIPLLNHPLLS